MDRAYRKALAADRVKVVLHLHLDGPALAAALTLERTRALLDGADRVKVDVVGELYGPPGSAEELTP